MENVNLIDMIQTLYNMLGIDQQVNEGDILGLLSLILILLASVFTFFTSISSKSKRESENTDGK